MTRSVSNWPLLLARTCWLVLVAAFTSCAKERLAVVAPKFNVTAAAAILQAPLVSTWYPAAVQHDPRRPAIVFVHGLASDARDCWLDESGKYYWPDILRQDIATHSSLNNAFEIPDIYVCNFFTKFVTNSTFSIQGAADSLDRDMVADGVWNHERIVFVTHSLGGLAAKCLITHKAGNIKAQNKSIGLALFASPAQGSELASTLKRVIETIGNHQAAQLILGCQDVLDIHYAFIDAIKCPDKQHCARPWILGREWVETECLKLKSWWPRCWWPSTIVVPDESLGHYFARHGTEVPDADHFQIVKPRPPAFDSEIALMNFYIEFIGRFPSQLGVAAGSPKALVSNSASGAQPDPQLGSCVIQATSATMNDVLNVGARVEFLLTTDSGTTRLLTLSRDNAGQASPSAYVSHPEGQSAKLPQDSWKVARLLLRVRRLEADGTLRDDSAATIVGLHTSAIREAPAFTADVAKLLPVSDLGVNPQILSQSATAFHIDLLADGMTYALEVTLQGK